MILTAKEITVWEGKTLYQGRDTSLLSCMLHTVQVRIKALHCCCSSRQTLQHAAPDGGRLRIIAVQMQRKLIPLLFAFNLQTYFSSTPSTYELITNKLEKFYFSKIFTYLTRALYLLRATNKVCGNHPEKYSADHCCRCHKSRPVYFTILDIFC